MQKNNEKHSFSLQQENPVRQDMENIVLTEELQDNEKTATNNQWISTGLKPFPDKRERRDGPGGEDAGH